jgi:hypothetical protein
MDSNEDDNPPPIGPPRSEDDSNNDIDDDIDDLDGYGVIETSHDDIPAVEVYHMEPMQPSIQIIHGLRPRKPRDYSPMYSHVTVMHHAMKQ